MSVRRIRFLLAPVIFITACSAPKQLIKDFNSDGCSLFPDGSFSGDIDWSDCCLEHDIQYWQGGTKEQRLVADSLFRQCLLKKTGDKKLADLMYQGVRLGGNPNIPSWYRWGYGWNYMRDYKPISEEEQKLIEEKLNAYYQNKPPNQ